MLQGYDYYNNLARVECWLLVLLILQSISSPTPVPTFTPLDTPPWSDILGQDSLNLEDPPELTSPSRTPCGGGDCLRSHTGAECGGEEEGDVIMRDGGKVVKVLAF